MFYRLTITDTKGIEIGWDKDYSFYLIPTIEIAKRFRTVSFEFLYLSIDYNY